MPVGGRDRARGARAARWLRSCTNVGADATLNGRPFIIATPGTMTIGDRFHLSSSPVTSHLVAGPEGVLEIGDDVSIGHGAAIAAYERVVIGDGTALGPFVIIMDTNFHKGSGDQSVAHDTRPVIIGKRCRIGSRVTLTRGAIVGDDTHILAGSVVTSEIPAGVCAGGARARVLGDADEMPLGWGDPHVAFQELVGSVLKLDAPPDLDAPPRSLAGWNETAVRDLTAALSLQHDIRLRESAIASARRLRDIVGIVQRTRIDQSLEDR